MMSLTDRFILLIAVVLVSLLYFNLWSTNDYAQSITVVDANGQQQQVSLLQDQQLHIHGKLGTSVLEIAQGRVRFIESPCQGKVCIHQGWLSEWAPLAACLPNAVSVMLDQSTTRFDAINF